MLCIVTSLKDILHPYELNHKDGYIAFNEYRLSQTIRYSHYFLTH